VVHDVDLVAHMYKEFLRPRKLDMEDQLHHTTHKVNLYDLSRRVLAESLYATVPSLF